MEKSDLQNHMIVETKDKMRFMVSGDILLGKDGYCDLLQDYNNNLTFKNREKDYCDIVKIYKLKSCYIKDIFNDKNLNLIWEREEMETKEYTIKQSEYNDINVSFFTNNIIKIEPNNGRGYSKSDSNVPIWMFSEKDDSGFGLTLDSAKEMIKDLQEIVDYMEEK